MRGRGEDASIEWTTALKAVPTVAVGVVPSMAQARLIEGRGCVDPTGDSETWLTLHLVLSGHHSTQSVGRQR